MMKPHTAERVEKKQSLQKAKHDATAKARKFHVGDSVYLKDFTGSRRWLAGKIVKETGPVSFHIQLQDGQQKRCHQDQLRIRVTEMDVTEIADYSDSVGDGVPEETSETTTTSDSSADRVMPPAANVTSEERASNLPETSTSTNHYPQRNRKPREWFEPGTK